MNSLPFEPFWVISDTHWFHQRMFEFEPGRPANADILMVRRWRETVGPGDVVLHLGDLAFAPKLGWTELEDLPGRKYLIRGNHDYSKKLLRYRELGFQVMEGRVWTMSYRGWEVRFSHGPNVPKTKPRVLSIHGHTHSTDVGSPRAINVSVERLDYRPARVTEVLDAGIAAVTGAARHPGTI